MITKLTLLKIANDTKMADNAKHIVYARGHAYGYGETKIVTEDCPECRLKADDAKMADNAKHIVYACGHTYGYGMTKVVAEECPECMA